MRFFIITEIVSFCVLWSVERRKAHARTSPGYDETGKETLDISEHLSDLMLIPAAKNNQDLENI